MADQTYDLFISYRSDNLDLAEKLHKQLVSEGFHVWFDKARLDPGCNWHAEIEAGCDASRIILPVLTPVWKESDWTRFETYGAEFVIPLLCEGDFADVTPLPLREYQFVDFRQPDESAWNRLLASIRQYLSQASPEKTQRLAIVPYAQNPYFVGREAELLELHEKLCRAPSTVLTQGSVQAVAGMGGVGKTTLAREYAEKFWRLYSNILWVRADRPLVFEFQRLAEELGLIRERSQDPELDARRALKELSGRMRRLLIMDNAPDEEAIQEWIPATGACCTIITSRFAGWSAAVQTIHVYVLEPAPARELLLKRGGLPDTDANFAAADRVAKELGYLPLALEHAAAFVREAAISFDQYLSYHADAKSRRDLMARRVLGSTQYPESVGTTWLVTIQRLGPLARSILRLISFLAPDDIPRSLVTEAGDFLRGILEPQAASVEDEVEITKYVLDQALMELSNYSMIFLLPESLSVHRLVQAVQRDGIDEPALSHWAERVVRLLRGAFPEPKFINWQPCERLITHVQACAEYIKRLDLQISEAPDLLHASGGYLHLRGQYAAAEPLFRQASEIYRTVLGARHPDFAASLNSLGILQYEIGNYADAETLHRQSLEIFRTSLGERHPDYAAGLSNLALLYRAMGNYAAAEPLFRQALEIERTALGEQHPSYANTLHNLAFLYEAMRNYSAAEPLYLQALDIWRTALGDQHPDYASSLNNLANLYCLMGKHAEAEPLYRQSLEIARTALGEQHSLCANCLNGLALLKFSTGDHAAAEHGFRQALEIWRTVLGEQHPEYATGLNNLATLYRTMGNYAAAEPLFRQALEIDRTALGEQHPSYAIDLSSLAMLSYLMGNYASAEPLYRQALEISRKVFGEEHSHFAGNLNSLARCLQEQGKHEEALRLCRQALAIREQRLEAGHPDIASSLNDLGLSLVCLGGDDNLLEAEQRLLLAVQISEKTPNPHYWLAHLYKKRGGDGDRVREVTEWQRYLELGPTSKERNNEALRRLKELSLPLIPL